MKAIIMAGGEGTRLRPLTSNRPKPMIPVMNKPVIEHMVNLLRGKGITDIIFSLFYLPENVQNYFGDGSDWDIRLTYSVEETPLGTAGGVKKAIGTAGETVVVLSGDGVVDFDLDWILSYHREKKSLFTIVLTRVKEPTEYGIVITREDGTIDRFLEKPAWSEVFSDTINTGIYVIEPSIINRYIPEKTKFDFSMDLFPLLQRENIPLYGCIAPGYWCDVGSLTAYRDVHQAILDGSVKMEIPGKKIGKDIWVGRNVEIDENAAIRGPVFIGNFAKIKAKADISEYSVIGNNCVIGEGASVRRSIILHNTIIGPRCEMRGAIIGKRSVIGEGVSVFEGAVVSDDCQVGAGSEIRPGMRVWPEKFIEEGTRLTSDLIWGQTEKKTLFGADGIVGAFNVRITPEFSAKLGSAFGAFLGNNATVIISRDSSPAARLIKRALSAGLLSMGVQVYDLDIESIPINRYSCRYHNADMSVYVQMWPMSGLQFIQIKILNRLGFRLTVAEERKIEHIFFRGDYPRKDAFEVGSLTYPLHHIESYITSARRYIDNEVLQRRKWSVLADCFYGATSCVFPDLLISFGCSVNVLRGQVRQYNSEEEIKNETRRAIENVTRMARINGDTGVIMGPHGEQLTVVDETGSILTDDDLCALISLYYMKYRGMKSLYIPLTSPMNFEKIASQYGCRVIRTSTKLRVPHEGAEDIFNPGLESRYPYLEKEYDPMITYLILLLFAAMEQKSLSEIRKALPASNLYRTSLPCTIDEKALIMRALSTSAPSAGTSIELIDGVRFTKPGGWVLVLPDAIHPLIHLYAEGNSIGARDAIISEYTGLINSIKIKTSANRSSHVHSKQ
jgi:mannose-1-phosphate guanylyltransferase / phosphomannomutase